MCVCVYVCVCVCVYIYMYICCSVAKLYQTFLQPHGLQTTRLLHPWNFPGKNTGVGCHFLLQGIFLTQGSKSCLLHWQVDSLPLSHQGSIYIYMCVCVYVYTYNTITLLYTRN